MRIPGLSQPVPLAALAALAVLGLTGCGLLLFAAFSLRPTTPSGTAIARGDAVGSATSIPVERTRVPTVIFTETPPPTITASPTVTNTPPPSATHTPEAEGTTSGTPARTATSTSRPATSAPAGGATAVPPTAVPPTSPPQPTAPPSSGSGSGSHGLSGALSLCNPKESYAAKSDTFEGERICFNELITNNTDQAINYGMLGVHAANQSGGADFFQTSWRGDLSVPARSNGPTGSGWQDGMYLAAGTYRLTLSICYSNVDVCLGAGGEWETLTSGITINVVPWNP